MRIFIDEPVKWALSSKVEVAVNAPVKDVFDYVESGRLWGRRLERRSPTRLAVGRTFTLLPPGEGGIYEYTVTEFVHGRRLAFEDARDKPETRTAFEFRPADSGTRVVYKHERVRVGLLLGVILALFFPITFLLALFLPAQRALGRWEVRRNLHRIESRGRR
jgi:hypothetical protein